MKNDWFYRGDQLPAGSSIDKPVDGYYGFTYLVTYVGPTTKEYKKGSIYVGKKAFSHATKKVLSKKAKLLPENKGKRILRGTKDSGWLDYYGSSKELIAFVNKVGKDKFTREILRFNKTKTRNTYEEIKAQMFYKVLEVPSFNLWVGGRVRKNHLKNEEF